ncbi:MAG: phosphoribosylglycinamide formyltransferase [Nitrospinota bacterium]|nr:phosphoribosylglycinamide formyltransferase [Nitrospinota bacterium]
MRWPASKLKVAALASGRGSNLQALIDAASRPGAPFSMVAVISDNPNAKALERARAAGVDAVLVERRNHATRQLFDAALAEEARKRGADLVCLAGFMRLLSPSFLSGFRGRVINIHPALLPSFPGLDAQKQALDYGVKVTGCTVHFVDEGVDTGPIILQTPVMVEEGDTAQTLSDRILEQEHLAYVKAVELIATGKIEFPHPRLAGAGA